MLLYHANESVCCIFHPNNEDEYEVEETESESESSSSSSSSSDESDHEGPSKPNAYERQPKYKRKNCAQCEHEHNHG
ncbi:hypothetical protein OGATHE_001983 [Ogataea polymorpha]|uniref:Uncharacterized protein n=1 Tax=Ogataea polymorpha TaxID=460523 RepID=A0A9P8PKS0_9ASCO|nr:hypothetical protein OGATHE_001983 [Ogataea polymorpha]